ncbi:elongation factor 1-gamma (EF-1-gamma) [Trypanosoma cruzi]|nr:elongation factor 1-gamma (EF-1-gamma) [Trypanosoma cruzi]
MRCMTVRRIRGWLQRMEHVCQYELGAALMVGEKWRHDIVALCVLCVAVAWQRLWGTWWTRSCWTEGGGGVLCGAAGVHDGCVCWEGPTIPRPVLEGRVLK